MERENGNAFANAYKYIKEQNNAESAKYQQVIKETAQKHQDAIDRIYNIRESRELARRNHSKLVEDCKNDALSTIIKAIYIEALCPGSLTDNALFIAEDLVDGWIRAKGGASKIIAECRNKTYLLNRICSITEEVALENVREIEFNESEGVTLKEAEDAEEEKKAKVTQMLAQANSLIAKATALQNGDESVLDTADADEAEAETTEDEAPAAEETPSTDVIDGSEPAEGEETDTTTTEEETETTDDGDPDLGDVEVKEEETTTETEEAPAEEEKKAEEEAPEEAEGAEEEESKEEEKTEDSESEEESEDDELSDDEEDEASEDDEDIDSEGDPDFGDIDDDDDSESTEDMEDGENEDQQDAEAELTGESLDDEDVEDDDDEEVIDNTSLDGENTEPQGKIFDELDKEEDVKKAVALISQRVADAEEDFIQRNAEDKKKIDDLLGKISDNIKTVENLSDNDSEKSNTEAEIAQEHTMMLKRQIKNITENRPQSVFEKMARKLTENVTKDSDLRSIYLAESGRTDMASVVEHTKVMYGFLEALTILQLEKVDAAYIENVLKNI